MSQKCTTQCSTCSKDILNRQFLVCALCENTYHLDCTSVTFQRFSIMTIDNKQSYRCDQCLYRLGMFSNSFNSSPTHETRTNESPKDQDYVTQRNRYNVQTQNSFELLSDDEAEYSSLPATPITLNRSCPEMRPNNICEVEELQKQIHQLQEKLQTAENEIENLLSENYAMSKKINAYELRNKQLTHICKTPSSNKSLNKSSLKINSQSKRRQNIIKTQLDFSEFMEHGHNQATDTHHATKPVEDNANDNVKCPKLARKKAHFHDKESFVYSSTDGPTERVKKIHILGDEQLKGLSAALIKSRKEKWNDVYKPSSLILTGATSTEILAFCENVVSDLNNDDIVILGCGKNDRDIHTLHSNICIALNKLKSVSVFIAPVNYNPYLNCNKLNRNIKLWTKHFTNCTVIDMDYYNYNDSYINYFCSRFNVCIDYFEYKKQYLTPKSIKKHIKNAIAQSKNIVNKNIVKNSKKPPIKKGTIPYYFIKEVEQTQLRPITPPNNIDKNNYFDSVATTKKPTNSGTNDKTFFRSQK